MRKQRHSLAFFLFLREENKCWGDITGQVAFLIRFGIIRMAEKRRVCGRGWRKQRMEWVDLALKRSKNAAIYRKRLSHQEACQALA